MPTVLDIETPVCSKEFGVSLCSLLDFGGRGRELGLGLVDL